MVRSSIPYRKSDFEKSESLTPMNNLVPILYHYYTLTRKRKNIRKKSNGIPAILDYWIYLRSNETQ